MNMLLDQGRPLHLAIREMGIAAASPLEARRLADALPAALERAFAQQPTARNAPLRQRRVDRVAAQIAGAVVERMKAQP